MLAGLGVAVVAGCAGDVTSPGASASKATAVPSASADKALTQITLTAEQLAALQLQVVPVVERTKALAKDVTVTKTIDVNGGDMDIGEAGLKVHFPKGALSAKTTITATAYAGKYVSYGFAPHGLQFNVPVTVTQQMDNTNLKNNAIAILLVQGAYMPDGQADILSDGSAIVSELLPTTITLSVDLDHLKDVKSAVFPIQHFSGYILSGGRR